MRRLALILAVVSSVLVAFVASSAATTAHTVVVRHTDSQGQVVGLDCLNAHSCEAVGHLGAGGVSAGLVVDEQGARLTSATIPGPVSGMGISCATIGSCQAVFAGYKNGFVTSVAGTKVGPHRGLPFGPSAISCPTRKICYVVGATDSGIHNLGAVEKVVKGKPDHTWLVKGTIALNGISCITAKKCVTVGESTTKAGVAVTLQSGKPLLLHLTDPSDVTEFLGVFCGPGPACDLVGDGFGASGQQGEIAYYNGRSVSDIVSDTAFSVLSGIDCGNSFGCELTGSARAKAAFVNLDNGVVSAPTRLRKAEASAAFGESCVGRTCVAAGFFQQTAKTQLLPAMLSLQVD